MPVLAVIPARMGSTRLPGKPLADLAGVPMVVRVLAQVRRARRVDEVVVATDSQTIVDAVTAHGGTAVLTSASHVTGTDRIAEVAAARPEFDLVLNVQGDEPLVDPAALDALVAALDDGFAMGTLVRPLDDAAALEDPHTVKVLVDPCGAALTFTRAPIVGSDGGLPLVHVGVYLFRRDLLLRYSSLPPSAREHAERLEQLRALDAGVRIRAVKTEYASVGVDTPEDLARVRRLLEAR